MSNKVTLEDLNYVIENSPFDWDRLSQKWFEGYITALNDYGEITDKEYNNVMDNLKSINKKALKIKACKVNQTI